MQRQLEQQKRTESEGDPFQKLQKPSQIIHIESKDSQFQMNLSGLVPNFNQLALSTDIGKAYYQLRSFRTKNSFTNVKNTDALRIYFKTQIIGLYDLVLFNHPIEGLNIQTYDNIEGEDMYGIDFELFPQKEDQEFQVTADQFVQQLNAALMYKFVTIRYDPPGAMFVANAYGQLATFLNCYKFVVENDGIQIMSNTPSQLQLAIRTDNANYYQDTLPHLAAQYNQHVFLSVKVRLTTEAVNDEHDKYRMAKMLGMLELMENGKDYYIDIELLPDQLMAHTVQSYEKTHTVMPEQEFQKTTVTLSSLNNGTSMHIFMVDRLYVHANLISNIWTKKGIKTDVIAIIPIQGTGGSQPIEYTPVGADARIYQIEDTLNSIQHMSISFTDQFNKQITFQDEYQMDLAIFFIK